MGQYVCLLYSSSIIDQGEFWCGSLLARYHVIYYCLSQYFSPAGITNYYSQKTLVNTMWAMCQWVVSVAITGTEALYLARIFMKHVLLKFEICRMIVIDDGNEFRGISKKSV